MTIMIQKTDFVSLYVEDLVGEEIIQKIINSTTWVHTVDINKTGRITEADYVLFKREFPTLLCFQGNGQWCC